MTPTANEARTDNMTWIPTSDPRRPEDGQRCNVASKGDSPDEVYCATYRAKRDNFDFDGEGAAAFKLYDYWLPIPSLPEALALNNEQTT